jgi:hypothetical protein
MPLTAKGEEIKKAMEKTYGPEKAERVLYASKNKGTISGIDKSDATVKASCGDELAHKLGMSDEGGVVGGSIGPSASKADMGPGHIAPHVGKDGLFHWPVSDDASPLEKAEARYDEDRLLEKIAAHCDALNQRLDAYEDAYEDAYQGNNPTLEYLEKLNRQKPAKGGQINEWGPGGQHPKETLSREMAQRDVAVSNRTHMTR